MRSPSKAATSNVAINHANRRIGVNELNEKTSNAQEQTNVVWAIALA